MMNIKAIKSRKASLNPELQIDRASTEDGGTVT